ncbi:helix-turn-helix transcriptional regulator [Xanthobacteraceae bacterium A53D]
MPQPPANDNLPKMPQWFSPRGYSRTEAAAYVGISPTLFDTMVKDGRMPQPKRVNSRTIWDVRKLDAAFESLPGDESADANPWDLAA